ncbi:MAG TPA: hypothetical protein VGB85_10630, partial [Nannocystis sp.]
MQIKPGERTRPTPVVAAFPAVVVKVLTRELRDGACRAHAIEHATIWIARGDDSPSDGGVCNARGRVGHGARAVLHLDVLRRAGTVAARS